MRTTHEVYDYILGQRWSRQYLEELQAANFYKPKNLQVDSFWDFVNDKRKMFSLEDIIACSFRYNLTSGLTKARVLKS